MITQPLQLSSIRAMENSEEYKTALSIQKSVGDALAKVTNQLSSLDEVC